MNKSTIKYISVLLLLAIFIPLSVMAQTITGMVKNVASVVLAVGGFIVFIFWIITGYLFVSAQGDPTKITKAKQALFYSIIGTAIMILATSAIDIIGNIISNGI